MKTIVYGPSGSGKSFTHIAQAIRENDYIFFVSRNKIHGRYGELESMHLPDETLTPLLPENLNDITVIPETGKYSISLYSIPELNQEEIFLNTVLPFLEGNEITENKNCTIILSDFQRLMNDKDFVDRITLWNANVVVEYMCSKIQVELGEIDYVLNNKSPVKWNNIPTFESDYYLQKLSTRLGM